MPDHECPVRLVQRLHVHLGTRSRTIHGSRRGKATHARFESSCPSTSPAAPPPQCRECVSIKWGCEVGGRLLLRGNDRPALVLLSHSDVVPVDEESWSRDQFGGELVDGFIWGVVRSI
jgi:acetylornithine deacetylase/succinyl-diaminopimelate desuccinylase-like protein